jgi:hypothetical protein
MGGIIRCADIVSASSSLTTERKTIDAVSELHHRKGLHKGQSKDTDGSVGEFKDIGRWEIDAQTKRMWLHIDGTQVVLDLRSNRRKAEAITADGSLSLFNFVQREPRVVRDLFQLKLTQEINSRSSIQQTSQFFEGTQWRWFADAARPRAKRCSNFTRSVCCASTGSKRAISMSKMYVRFCFFFLVRCAE